MLETEVFQLVLDPTDAQPVGQRRVNFQRFLRNGLPFRRAQMLEGAHVVQAVGQLDEHDANVVRHREQHLAEIFRLLFLMALERDLADLRDTVDEMHHVLPELALEFFGRGHRVLKRVMEQCGNDGSHVRLQGRQHTGDRDGMLQIGLARTAPLPFVHLR